MTSMMIGLNSVGFSDPAWPNGYGYILLAGRLVWVMLMIWLAALVLACIEMRRKHRWKWLAVYAALPVLGVAIIFGLTCVAVRYTAPPQEEY